MAASIKTHPAMVLSGGGDVDSTLRERFLRGEGLIAHADAQSLFADPGIDVIYVATPHEWHREHTIAALRAGKHVVVEKPMALSLTECDAMIAAAKQYDRYLIVGHTHGFDPTLSAIRRVIDSGRLGKVGMLATANYTDFLYRPRRPEELDSNRGGGVLFNQLPHQIDILRTVITSPLRSVRAAGVVLDSARPTEGACIAFLEFEDGMPASLVYSGYDGFDSDEWHEWTTEGGFAKKPTHGQARRALKTLDPPAELLLRRDAYGYGSGLSTSAPPAQPHFGTLVITCERGDIKLCADGFRIYGEAGEEHLKTPLTPWRPGRGDVLEELRAAVQDGVAPLHDGRFGRDTVAACLAILQSTREKREIFLNSSSTGTV